MKVVAIKPKPRWKIWKLDNLEVTVSFGDGILQTVGIFIGSHYDPKLLKQYVKNKLQTGNQFRNVSELDEEETKKLCLHNFRKGQLPKSFQEIIGVELDVNEKVEEV